MKTPTKEQIESILADWETASDLDDLVLKIILRWEKIKDK